MKKEVAIYRGGRLFAKLFGEVAKGFLSETVGKTKTIKLDSGETAFEFTIDDLFWIGFPDSLKVFVRKGDFFIISG